MGVIPREDVDKIRDNAKFSVERIREIEEQTRHDVVAFTRAVSESLGEERKWVHYGLTSTDVVDTANGYLLKQADEIRKGTIYSKYRQFINNCFELCPRQALHAKTLGFVHPRTGEWLQFDSAVPEDMTALLDKWRKYCGQMPEE